MTISNDNEICGVGEVSKQSNSTQPRTAAFLSYQTKAVKKQQTSDFLLSRFKK